jgi:transposase
LLPHLANVVVEAVERTVALIRIMVRPAATSASCPSCGIRSGRVHSRYRRRLADASIGGVCTELLVHARRWLCDDDGCPARTFAEQIDGLTTRHARRTPVLRQLLERIGLALAGRAGARLSGWLGLPTSRSSLLRLVRGLPDPEPTEMKVVGVDDFAVRRGHRYGTVLVDLDTHRPVELLPDRESETVSRWLRSRPSVQVVCRDRAGAYAEAARTGAPQAIQVADRWHLWHNLAQQVEKTVAVHRRCVPTVPVVTDSPFSPGIEGVAIPTAADQPVEHQQGLVARTRQRHQRVHELLDQGLTIREVCRQLALSRGTVRGFARARQVEDVLTGQRHTSRVSTLAPFVVHLHERWAEGVTNAATLYAEIRALGYRGASSTVRAYLNPLRRGRPSRALRPTALTTRQMTGLLTRHPDDLDQTERQQHHQIRAACPHLDRLAEHVSRFAVILTQLRGDELNAWMAAVQADDLPHLHSFVGGVQRDYDAVRNGLTLPPPGTPCPGRRRRPRTLRGTRPGRGHTRRSSARQHADAGPGPATSPRRSSRDSTRTASSGNALDQGFSPPRDSK